MQPIDRYARFAHVAVWHTSLPLSEKDLPLALAGSIPTEFGELINLTDLYLSENNLTGKHPFAHVANESTTC